MFGVDFAGDRKLHSEVRGHRLFSSQVLEGAWRKGFCTVGDLSYESAAYVARYVVKKKTGVQGEEAYSRLDLETGEVHCVAPPFVSMSRRPGIGSGWFERFRSDVFPADEVIHKGRRFRPPRFYDEKLPEEELVEIKERRREKVGARSSDLSAERLAVREKVLNRKVCDLLPRGI